MEKNYFLRLSKIEKIDFVWNYGEIINEIETPEAYTSLFLLHNFFVEVSLDKSSDEITSILTVDNTNDLYKFVQKLDLGLFQHG